VVRDAEHWRFLWARSLRFFERLSDASLRYRRQVALSGDRFAGYLVTVEGRGEWYVREVGAADGDPEVMVTILRLGADQAQRAGARVVYGWFPPELHERLRDWGLRGRPRRRAIPMILGLEGSVDLRGLDAPGAAYLSFQDQF
jgi:hypothetical protein